MDNREIRLANLRALVREYADGNVSRFVEVAPGDGGMRMNAFTMTGTGKLVRNPERVPTVEGSYARFCIVGQRENVATALWCVAFGTVGEEICKTLHKNDRVTVVGYRRANAFIPNQPDKEDALFVVRELRLGEA